MYFCDIVFFFFNDTATTEIYTLSLHDALPISPRARVDREQRVAGVVGPPQHVLQLERLELGSELLGLAVELVRQTVVAVGLGQLAQGLRVVQPLAQRVVGLEPALQLLHLLDHLPRPPLVGPDAAFRHGVLQLAQPLGLPFYVKGSSAAR